MNTHLVYTEPLPDPAVAHLVVDGVVAALPAMPWAAARDVAVASMQTGRLSAVVLAASELGAAEVLAAAVGDVPPGVAVVRAGTQVEER